MTPHACRTSGFDALLMYPPPAEEAVFPYPELPEIKAFLESQGTRAAIRDLNAEFCYAHIYSENAFAWFSDRARKPGRSEPGPPEFPAGLRPDSPFAKNPIGRCTLHEIRDAAHRDFVSHRHYLRTFLRLPGACADTRGQAPAPLLRDFFARELRHFLDQGFPHLVGILIDNALQLGPAAVLAELAKQASPECRVVGIRRGMAGTFSEGKNLLERFPWFDGYCAGHAPGSLHALASRTDARAVPPGVLLRTPGGFTAGAAQAEPLLPYVVPDFNDFPLDLYPARMLPVRAGQAAEIVKAMKRQFVDTGFESFLLFGRRLGGEDLGRIAQEILARRFLGGWSAPITGDAQWGEDLCGLLYRSGCRSLFLPAPGLHGSGKPADTGSPGLAQCAGAGLRVVVEISHRPGTDPGNGLAFLHAHRHAIDGVLRHGSAAECGRCPGPDPVLGPELDGLARPPRETHVSPVDEFISAFHTERAIVPRLDPDYWIECSHSQSPYRSAPPRDRILLSMLSSDHCKNEKPALALSLRCLQAYAARDRAITDRLHIEPVMLSLHEEDSLLVETLAAHRPVLAGFSCYEWNISRTLAICRGLKKACPETVIVLGGPEVSDAGEVLQSNPWVDMVVRGEGEIPFHALLHSLFLDKDPRSLARVPGLVFREAGEIHAGETQGQQCPADELPTVYTPASIRALPLGFPVLFNTSRGCAYQCKYCHWARTRGIHTTHINRVRNDLRTILRHKRSPKQIVVIIDSCFNHRLPRMKRILQSISDLGLPPARFSVFMKPDRLDHECARLFKELGEVFIHLGVETIHEDVLRNAGRRPIPEAQIIEVLDMLAEHGLMQNVAASVILGLPGDTWERFLETLRWCWRHRLQIFVFRMQLLPGTEFRKSPEPHGFVYDPGPPHLVRAMHGFSADDFARAQQTAVNYMVCMRYFNRSDLETLHGSAFDLPGFCSALDLGGAFYEKAAAAHLQVSSDLIADIAGARFTATIEACLHKLDLRAETKDLIMRMAGAGDSAG